MELTRYLIDDVRHNCLHDSVCEWEGEKLTLYARFKRAIHDPSEDGPLRKILANYQGPGMADDGNHGNLPQVSSSNYQQPHAWAVSEVTKYRFRVSH